ncbi:MAG: LysE family translocator [Kordiimonadaceae bacterium]|nr:LysE family translocator [Kordiimonadaceae bacterium]
MSFIFAIGLYAFSMSASPGPTNIILFTSGVNHGFLKSVPFATGAVFGYVLLNIFLGLGISEFTKQNEYFLTAVSYIGAGFIFYMGAKIAFSNCNINLSADKTNTQKAPGFINDFFLQWINPKAWIAGIAGISAFITAGNMSELFVYIAVYGAVGYLSILLWAYGGSKIARFLNNCRNMKIFNLTMGGGLILIAGYLIAV